MVDKEKLRYDLALHAAAVMTLRDSSGTPTDKCWLISSLLIHDTRLRNSKNALS